MISSAHRQPSTIRIRIAAETTGFPDTTFSLIWELRFLSFCFLPVQINDWSSFYYLRFLGYYFILHAGIYLFIDRLTDNITENNQDS